MSDVSDLFNGSQAVRVEALRVAATLAPSSLDKLVDLAEYIIIGTKTNDGSAVAADESAVAEILALTNRNKVQAETIRQLDQELMEARDALSPGLTQEQNREVAPPGAPVSLPDSPADSSGVSSWETPA